MSIDPDSYSVGRGGRTPLADASVKSAGHGDSVADFSEFGSVLVEVRANLSQQRAEVDSALAVTVERSTDGESWTTVDTASFSASGSEIITDDAPERYLRVSWASPVGLWGVSADAIPAEVNVAVSGASLPEEWTERADGGLLYSNTFDDVPYEIRLGGDQDADIEIWRNGIRRVSISSAGSIDLRNSSNVLSAGISSSGVFFAGDVQIDSGMIIAPSLPTADPMLAGAFWNDLGDVKISLG